MDFLRTPDSRFAGLDGYPFPPHYLDVTADGAPPLRMHYIDEGPRDGAPVVLLHGEPTWSYLYRTMIEPLAAAGHRVLAPDLIGFGRSDKPTRRADYTYARHVAWVTDWLTQLDLTGVTVVVQDWGSLIGLRMAAENPDRFAKLFIANGFLPIADRPTPPAFRIWRAFAKYSPALPSGWLVDRGTVHPVPKKIRDGYDAPFPDKSYKEGSRAFPQLVPTSPEDPGHPGQPGGVGGAGPLDQTGAVRLRRPRPDPRQGRRSADPPYPRRGRPAARPDQRRPLHPGGRRARTRPPPAGLGSRACARQGMTP